MQALIIDAGNSRVSCAAWDGAHQLPRLVWPGGREMSPPVPLRPLDDLAHPAGPGGEPAFLESFTRVHGTAGAPPVVLVSVIPRIVDLLAGTADVLVVDHQRELPFGLGVKDVSQVGPDRLCNVAAAVSAGLENALVVDAGTATTFDLLLDGVFLGGMIAPGMAFAAQQLGERAARLRPVPFGPASWEVGRDTAGAMAGGAWHAGRGGVHAVVDGLIRRYGDMPVVITGGLGRHLDVPGAYHDTQWTLRGGAILSISHDELPK